MPIKETQTDQAGAIGEASDTRIDCKQPTSTSVSDVNEA